MQILSYQRKMKYYENPKNYEDIFQKSSKNATTGIL